MHIELNVDDDRLIVATDSSGRDVSVAQDKFWPLTTMDGDVGVEAISTLDYRPSSAIRMIERVHSTAESVVWAVEQRAWVEEWEVEGEVD